jgi:Cof subfamily protein (haloacid dehalogenase superfamily)
MKYLIFLDLDGTLLDKSSSLSTNTVSRIKEITNSGHKVIITTGRSFESSKLFYHTLKLTTPIITDNGATIFFSVDDKVVPNFEYFEKSEIKKIYDIFEPYYYSAFISYNGYTNAFGPLYNKYLSIFPPNEKDYFRFPKIEEIFYEKVNTIILFIPNEKYEEFKEEFNKKISKSISFRKWPDYESECAIEIYLAHINKGYAVKNIIKYYNNDFKTIALGDGLNDLEMLKSVDNGIAMKESHPYLIENGINPSIYSNGDDGVVKCLEEIINNKEKGKQKI